MTPDEMGERLAAWACRCDLCCHDSRRVVCVEPDGPRRTWVLTEGGRQVGLVRMRRRSWRGGEKRGWCQHCQRETTLTVDWPWGFMPRTGCTECDTWFDRHHVNPDERAGDEPPAWTVEASDRTRAMLGLDSAPQSRQTAPEEGSQ